MSDTKPETVDEYKRWLQETRNVAVTDRTEVYYVTVADSAKKAFEQSPFWTSLLEDLKLFNEEYIIKTEYPLMVPGVRPEILTKKFDSFFQKTLRTNVLWNRRWPHEPKNGWVLPSNWFTLINDIVRTSVIVKYLDGVSFVSDKIKLLADKYDLPFQVDYLARDEGYYAAHITITPTFDIPTEEWGTKPTKIPVEIQITTQLQDMIGKLTHGYYEVRRERSSKPETKWQWDYKSDEFVVNYLGHILHYLEAMILEVRDKRKADQK